MVQMTTWFFVSFVVALVAMTIGFIFLFNHLGEKKMRNRRTPARTSTPPVQHPLFRAEVAYAAAPNKSLGIVVHIDSTQRRARVLRWNNTVVRRRINRLIDFQEYQAKENVLTESLDTSAVVRTIRRRQNNPSEKSAVVRTICRCPACDSKTAESGGMGIHVN